MDIMGPVRKTTESNDVGCIRSTNSQGKEVNLFQPASEFLPMISLAYKRLGESVKDIAGARMEDNKFCVSVHCRNVAEDVIVLYLSVCFIQEMFIDNVYLCNPYDSYFSGL